LGSGAGWDELAAWAAEPDASFASCLRQSNTAIWVLIEGMPRPGCPPVLDALAVLLGKASRRIPWREGSPEDRVKDVVTALRQWAPAPGDQVILVGAGEGAHLAVRSLTTAIDLRDRVRAVLSVGGVVMGLPDDSSPYGARALTDWMAHWFRHEHLDPDTVRLTPYFSLQWVDREQDPLGALGIPVAASRFPTPEDEDSGGLEVVECVDLGLMSVDPELPIERVAQALWTVVTCWVAVRR
jgi:hypothetical protein